VWISIGDSGSDIFFISEIFPKCGDWHASWHFSPIRKRAKRGQSQRIETVKRILSFLLLCSFICLPSFAEETRSPEAVKIEPKGSEQENVYIRSGNIGIPEERVILARRGSAYGAIKFPEFWESPGNNIHGKYESYYQGDGSGDFSRLRNQRFLRAHVGR